MVFAIVVLSLSLTSQEQLLVELINRARLDPEGEAALHDIPLNDGLEPGTISSLSKPPLAPHQALIEAAGSHSQAMLDENFFSHTNPAGQSVGDRAEAAGYCRSVGENIAWGGSRHSIDSEVHVYLRHKQLFLSPCHRKNLLLPRFREIGTGLRFGPFICREKERNVCMVTEVFGNRRGDSFITGVVYADTIVADDFYSIGEGAAEISISAVDESGRLHSATTSPSGGYSLRVPEGTYTVTASGDAIDPIVAEHVVVNGENVKVDFETSDQVPVTPVPPQIVDDGDPGFSISGSWQGTYAEGYHSDSLVAVGGSGDQASWTFHVRPGRYRVSATWPDHAGAASDAQFNLLDDGRPLTTVAINQKRAASGSRGAGIGWQVLGEPVEIAGELLVVQLAGSGSGSVVADAILVQPAPQ